MNFEKHLFISYAHIDNQPLTAEQQGWVTRFHKSLEPMLSTRIGRQARIWRDEKISGNDVFADEIVQQFPKTALLVTVLSPCYVNSAWCEREVREFIKAAEQSGGTALGNKSRVIKVIKMPVDSEDPLPSPVKQVEGYDFYVKLDETPLEMDPAYGPEMAQKYNLKLARLALDVKDLLEKLEAASPGDKAVPQLAPAKPAVYLAQCSYERREVREALATELRFYGYQVLPDRQLPTEEADYVAEVTHLLERCGLSIHLIGSSYGLVPDGPSQKSVVVLQNELAAQRSRGGSLRRVIWLPDGTQSQHPEEQRFIEALHKEPETQFGADLITADLETLKGAIHAALQKLEKPEAPKADGDPAAARAKLVYLICDPRDRPATVPMRKFLRNQGFEVKIPLFEGDSGTVRQANQELLGECDAALLFYGAGDEAWKRTVESDLKKIKGYPRERPLAASYTYLAPPATGDKNDLVELEEPNLINGLAGFSEAGMTPLLDALQRA